MKKIIGIEKLDYTNKKGKRVIGHILHYVDVETPENVEGYRASNTYFKGECDLNLGDCIEIYFNEFGTPIKVETISGKE